LPGGGSAGVGFDVLLGFATSNSGGGAHRFNLGDSVIFTISGTGIHENSFQFLNTENAANVGSHIALGGAQSSFVSNIPIPATAWLLGSGLIGLVALRRRSRSKRRKKQSRQKRQG